MEVGIPIVQLISLVHIGYSLHEDKVMIMVLIKTMLMCKVLEIHVHMNY